MREREIYSVCIYIHIHVYIHIYIEREILITIDT